MTRSPLPAFPAMGTLPAPRPVWHRQLRFALPAVVAVLPRMAWAQDGALDVADGGDTAWLLTCAMLTLLAALPGLGLFFASRARSGNAISVTMQGLAITAAVSIVWIVAGYTVAFGNVSNGWLGSGNAWMLIELGNVREGTGVPESAFVLFQIALAAFAAVSMTGAWAGRARFGWVVAFASLWTLVVYAPVAHWIWGGGWLAQGVGTLDWGGGIVIETTAGISALVIAIMLGRGHFNGAPRCAVTSPPMLLLGTVLLWLGWFGIVGGAALAANDDAAAAIVGMHAACCSGALIALVIDRLRKTRPSARSLALGAVAGLATISPAVGYVSPGAAILIGAIGALVSRPVNGLIESRFGIDDRLGVFATFGLGGISGSILLAVFQSESLGGVGYDEGMGMVAQLTAQVVAIFVVAIWSIIASVILALMASTLFPMRVSEDSERDGLDSASHGIDPL